MVKAVETLTDADRRVFANAGNRFPVVAITNAAVSMLANTLYHGSISTFSTDRIYTLPAGVIGDIIEVALTTGNTSHELIIAGDTGITINNGTSATEWSRLFMDRERVSFRATSTTNWDVWFDGRRFEFCEVFGNATTAYTTGAWTQFTLGGFTDADNLRGTNEIVPRRAGRYEIKAYNSFQPSGGVDRFGGISNQTAGASFSQSNIIKYDLKNFSTAVAGESIQIDMRYNMTIGNSIKFGYYVSPTLSGTDQYYTAANLRPSLALQRVPS